MESRKPRAKARRTAVAIAYAEGDSAPRVVAAGRGERAERIVDLAREAGVAVVEESALAELLEPLEVGALVPDICWEAVARVLAFVMKIEEGK